MRSQQKRSNLPAVFVLVLFIAVPALLALSSFALDVSASELLGPLADIGTPSPPPDGSPTTPPDGSPTTPPIGSPTPPPIGSPTPPPIGTPTPPLIEILAPLTKSVYDFGVPITLVGSATDAQDGDISSLISWSSNIDGTIGVGATVVFSGASSGVHRITAEVTDSHGATVQDSILIRVFKNRPPVAILFKSEVPGGIVGEWIKSVALFGDKNGSDNFLTLQVFLDAGDGNPNSLNVQYFVDTNELYLQEADTDNWIGPCTPGEFGTLSNGNVEINCRLTVPYFLAKHFIKLRVLARWLEPIDEPIVMDVFLRATDRYGNDSGFVPKGTWTLLP